MKRSHTQDYYDFETLDRACRTPVLHIQHGIAVAEDWVARADRGQVFGRDPEGKVAQHYFELRVYQRITLSLFPAVFQQERGFSRMDD